jgi:hypothetical protein
MSNERDDAEWLTTMTRYEQFPLALRVRPRAPTATNRARFTWLASIEHRLSHVRDDGMPEQQYNACLEEFDLALQAAIQGHADGIVAIIETFGGKRTYYAYVHDDVAIHARITEFLEHHPQHQVSVTARADPRWKFYERYRADFQW